MNLVCVVEKSAAICNWHLSNKTSVGFGIKYHNCVYHFPKNYNQGRLVTMGCRTINKSELLTAAAMVNV